MFLTACPPGSGGPTTTITINPTEKTMYVDDTQEFEASITKLGTAISNDDVLWSVSCGRKLIIGKNKIRYTSPATIGSCDITAKLIEDRDNIATAMVTVIKRPSLCVDPPAVPDLNLQKAIKAQLEINRDINCHDLEGMSELRQVSNRHRPTIEKISNLSGLEFAINLKKVYLSYNSIVDISVFSKFTKLEYVTLHSNRIVNVEPLKELDKLYFLQLSSNRIVDLRPLRNLRALSKLRIFANTIEDISALRDLRNLDSLWLSHNRIKDISALVANIGLSGVGDDLRVDHNCLDLDTGSQNLRDINILKNRDIKLKYEPQKDCS